MGIRNGCAAFDVAAVCSGFLYGVTIAGQFIQNGTYERVLVIGADTFSKITDWNHRDCVFFGDGAGAVVLERKDRENGLFSSILLADGEGMNHFTVYPEAAYFTMNGKTVYETATTILPECIRQILCINRLRLEDVSMIIPHQAFGSRPQAHRGPTQHPFFPNADEPGVVREHRWSLSPAALGPGQPARTYPRRRSSLVRRHRRRLDLGRIFISMVRS
jgi:3-oxoacyl-[acyl-carrier-protein] synthase III